MSDGRRNGFKTEEFHREVNHCRPVVKRLNTSGWQTTSRNNPSFSLYTEEPENPVETQAQDGHLKNVCICARQFEY